MNIEAGEISSVKDSREGPVDSIKGLPEKIRGRWRLMRLSPKSQKSRHKTDIEELVRTGQYTEKHARTIVAARLCLERARKKSLINELTGLYNRRGFLEEGRRLLKIAGRTNNKTLLLFADFDKLKWINDTLGHPIGDQALREVADVFKDTFRESDIIARIAGDEFGVLAMEIDEDRVEENSTKVVTNRLQEKIEERNAEEGRRYRLSLSVGVVRYDPQEPCSIDELLARADRAMYKQKKAGQTET